MSYKLRIVFHGLCVFVPDKALSNRPNFKVLLVNTGNSVARLTGGDCATHYPILEFALKNVAQSAAPAIGETRVPWRIGGTEVRLTIPNRSPQGVDVNLIGGEEIGEVPNGSDDNDFRWVPNLEEILPNCKGISTAKLGFPVDDDTVAARVVVDDGALGTASVGRFNQDPVVVHFAPERGAHGTVRRAVAKDIELTFDAVDNPVTFTTYELEHGTKQDELVLAPARIGGKDESLVVVHVSNLCPDQFLAAYGPSPELPVRDEDFAWLYALTKNIGKLALGGVIDPRILPIPVPVKYTLKEEQGGGEPIKCASARSNPAT